MSCVFACVLQKLTSGLLLVRIAAAAAPIPIRKATPPRKHDPKPQLLSPPQLEDAGMKELASFEHKILTRAAPNFDELIEKLFKGTKSYAGYNVPKRLPASDADRITTGMVAQKKRRTSEALSTAVAPIDTPTLGPFKPQMRPVGVHRYASRDVSASAAKPPLATRFQARTKLKSDDLYTQRLIPESSAPNLKAEGSGLLRKVLDESASQQPSRSDATLRSVSGAS